MRIAISKWGMVCLAAVLWLMPALGQVGPADPGFFSSGTPGGSGPSVCGLSNNIAAYWNFDQNYTDSFNAQVLTPSGSPTFTKYPNIWLGYGSLDGDPNGYAQMSDNATLGMGGDVSFTMSFWTWSQYALGASKAYIDKGTNYDLTHDTYLVGTDLAGNWRFAVGDGSTHNAAVTINWGVSQNVWHNIIVKYDAAVHQINMAVDGVLTNPVSWTFGTWRNSGNFSVLANSAGSFNQKAYMDDLVVWTNRALTTAEIGMIYTNSLQGLTPLTYCSGAVGRYVVYFNGDARFATSGSSNSIPAYFQNTGGGVAWAPLPAISWASNHNATIISKSDGSLTNHVPSPPNLEQLDDWYTNNASAWLADYSSYKGPHTNLVVILQNGINDIFIMSGAPLYGVWTHQTIATAFTNWVGLISSNGINVVSTTIISQIGLDLDAGDGSGMSQEQVRAYVNQVIINQFPSIFGGLNADLWSPTNNSPMYWNPSINPSEYNDIGATNFAAHLNALFNSLIP